MTNEKSNVPDPSQDNWKRDCYDWLQMLTFVLVAVVMVFTFFGMVNSVVGSSMYPTLHDKDIMLAYRLGYTPAQGDVVVIRKESFMEEAIVKRVIATEGQEVEINYDTNTVYVDGVAMDEPYINQEDADVMEEKQGMVYKEFTVPEGCIFVMGDNRNGSTDSASAAWAWWTPIMSWDVRSAWSSPSLILRVCCNKGDEHEGMDGSL